MKKLIKIFQIISYFIAILLITLFLIPTIVGFRPYVVLSGSMEPVIKTGSVVYINTHVKPSEIMLNDIISFKIVNGQATHRVVKINDDNTFTTKGDANKVEDITPVGFNNYIGKTSVSIPYLGRILSFLRTKQGLISTLIVIFINIAIVIFCDDNENNKKTKNNPKENQFGNKNDDMECFGYKDMKVGDNCD